MIATSSAPTADEVAFAIGRNPREVEAAFHALAEARLLVLRQGTSTIWMAMPFANVQTGYTVVSGGRAYYATCGSDAFGVAAMLTSDSRIFTTCGDCGGVLERKIVNRTLADPRGVVHMLVPPRAWWDDLERAYATTMLFVSEAHVDRWCAKQRIARGAIVSFEQAWIVAQRWYGQRQRAWIGSEAVAEAEAAFSSAGLTGAFWALMPPHSG